MAAGASTLVSVDVVSACVDAFNARDLDGLLNCVDGEVDVGPLRLTGVEGAYGGPDRVGRWFERLAVLERLGVVR